MKKYFRLLQAAGAMLTIALIVSGTDVESILLHRAEDSWADAIRFVVQVILALLVARAIDVAVSLSGSILRWIRHHQGAPRDRPLWRSTTPEGLIVGLVAVGIGLGWSPRDVYPHPEEPRQFELRYPSLLENPLLFPPGSRGLASVLATYRDSEKHTTVQTTWEFTDDTATERVAGRTILWSTSGPGRGIVKTNSGECLFFPETLGGGGGCLSDTVTEAYLRGESIDEVLLMDFDEHTDRH